MILTRDLDEQGDAHLHLFAVRRAGTKDVRGAPQPRLPRYDHVIFPRALSKSVSYFILFIEIRTFETLLRSFELRSAPPPSIDRLMAGHIRNASHVASSDNVTKSDHAATDESDSAKRPRLDPAPATAPQAGSKSMMRVVPEMRGHTSFLTFATLLPPYGDETKGKQ